MLGRKCEFFLRRGFWFFFPEKKNLNNSFLLLFFKKKVNVPSLHDQNNTTGWFGEGI